MLLVCATICMTQSFRAGAEPTGADGMSPTGIVTASDRLPQDVGQLLSRIREAGSQRDMDGLYSLAAFAQTPRYDDDSAVSLMKALCEQLTQAIPDPALERRRGQLLEQCAQWALATHLSMPLADQAYFMSRPLLSDTQVTGDAWVLRRKSRTDAWFTLWRKLDAQEGARGYANDDQSAASSRVASSRSDIYPHITPGLEKDSHSRQDSNALHLASVRRYYTNAAEAFLISAYSRPPYDVDDLRRRLNSPLVSDELRWRILGKVLYNMSIAQSKS